MVSENAVERSGAPDGGNGGVCRFSTEVTNRDDDFRLVWREGGDGRGGSGGRRFRRRWFSPSLITKLFSGLLWFFLQILLTIYHLWTGMYQRAFISIIYCGLLQKFKNTQLKKLRNLAIIIDSKEAQNTRKVKELLGWLSGFKIDHIVFYDIEGFLQKSIGMDLKNLSDKYSDTGEDCGMDGVDSTTPFVHRGITLEFLSYSDSKDALSKASTILCSRYCNVESNDHTRPLFTEADLINALKATGCGEPEPDLLLVYGPARCHLGFPAWRLCYTEIVHMGYLASTSCSAVRKALDDFSQKRQNYGRPFSHPSRSRLCCCLVRCLKKLCLGVGGRHGRPRAYLQHPKVNNLGTPHCSLRLIWEKKRKGC